MHQTAVRTRITWKRCGKKPRTLPLVRHIIERNNDRSDNRSDSFPFCILNPPKFRRVQKENCHHGRVPSNWKDFPRVYIYRAFRSRERVDRVDALARPWCPWNVLEFYILSLNVFVSLKSPWSLGLIKYSRWNVLELHLVYWNLVKFKFKLSLGHHKYAVYLKD